MQAVRDAIADRLLGLTEITDLIAIYRGVPAIINTEPVPRDVTGLYIVVRDAFYDVEFGTKTPSNPPADLIVTRGRIVYHDIAMYEESSGNSTNLEIVSLLVRDAFNRYPLPVSGWGTLIAKTRGPTTTSSDPATEEHADGRVVTVELTVIKQP